MNTSGPRWLSTEEQQTWRAFMYAFGELTAAVDAQLQRDSGMPVAYYEILVRLSEAPGHAQRMTQLADSAGASKSRLSHAVARLEERGWVRREDCPTDRRGQIAILTGAGYAALVEAAPGHVEQVRRSLFDALTPEQVKQLREISAAISAASQCPRAATATDEECPGTLLGSPCDEEEPADRAEEPTAQSG